MGGNKRTADRQRKANHYKMSVQHSKRALQKKRIEEFQKMMEDKMPKPQQENVVESPEVMVDFDDVQIIPDEEVKSE